ncbi:MAG: 3-hydroxyacyl-ACP dehydratase [Paludibacterium sp.]|uniref:3-hydroxyacyl-ACP dehydratase FabZ family protein n=1 Tax=Paludibacterium sp. TaxID=1917523 RepID=UPI0026015D8A|nr:3-hydroxyacyl-ACP dehydratase [Paludibacterium sp.]MBV8047878.1 3-hydroxyacyl-ACP dehydratase [Paludibacterium sp.]MBV8649743.1 3-hydroxyacyl-ACP dehydratase [Paludibacterium sp.]
MTDDAGYRYPIALTRSDIEAVLPHRGDIFFCQRLTIDGPHHFSGVARWSGDNPLIRGHFPGMPVVPGVMLIEAAAQLAGAGLLVGDPYVKTLPAASVGVLAGVRNGWFKAAVRPETDVAFAIQCRQLAPALVQVNAQITVGDSEAARVEFSLAYVPSEQVFAG